MTTLTLAIVIVFCIGYFFKAIESSHCLVDAGGDVDALHVGSCELPTKSRRRPDGIGGK